MTDVDLGGRPVKDIDWDKVDELLMAGCFTTEIAANIGVHKNTLYQRCEKEKGCGFSAYSQEKKAKGESLLRKVQYDVAMSGDRTMLVWLGKQRLDQHDKAKIEQTVIDKESEIVQEQY